MRHPFPTILVISLFLLLLAACAPATPIAPTPIDVAVNSSIQLTNGTAVATLTNLGNGEWSCTNDNTGGDSTCVSVVQGTTNFFYGTEKFATTDVNHVDKITLVNNWYKK
ncbi:hypothetical protein GW927_04465 [Candidatus Pacearchaeota archaeon]|nr:hypothetical protein [Candidatus Pacearchaeota archaeon]